MSGLKDNKNQTQRPIPKKPKGKRTLRDTPKKVSGQKPLPSLSFDVVQQIQKEIPKQLPEQYGDNHIFIMVRDPYWIYAYWEIQKERQEVALNQLGGDWSAVKSILRVYDTSDRSNRPVFFNIDLSGLAKTWYIEGQPNRSYVVEIGLLHNDGRFIPLAKSNEVTTPRAWMSEIIDEEWMCVDFEKMYALSGGFEVGKSSQELRRLMEERLFKSISSGSGTGASPVRK